MVISINHIQVIRRNGSHKL